MARIEIDDKLYEKFKSFVDEENLDEKEEIENLFREFVKCKKLLKFIKQNKN